MPELPTSARLHGWCSETEEEEEDPEDPSTRPLPDEISVNNLLDGVSGWSGPESGGEGDSLGGAGSPPPPPETGPPAESPAESAAEEQLGEPTDRQTPDTASAAASPDRCSQVR